MQLLIMRHGDAETQAASDVSRPLSNTGQRQVTIQAEKLVSKIGMPARIMASPLLRAQQTAGRVKEVAGFAGEIETSALISPEGNPGSIMEEIIEPTLPGHPIEPLLLVSHQPLVSTLILYLTGDKLFLNTANIVAISLIYPIAKSGEVLWFL